MSNRSSYLILFSLALANTAPLFFIEVAGDSHWHRIFLHCFAEQFWQGDFYPRWCMSANAGLGAPVFFFYFPLAYYIGTVFYPLLSTGIIDYHWFAFLCFASGMISAVTCWRWLKPIVPPACALFGTALYLYAPYRAEVMLYRAGYAELWFLAFLPLFFSALRSLAQVPSWQKVAMLSLVIAGLLLCHVPCTLIVCAGGGVYLGFAALNKKHAFLQYGIAGVLALGVTAFYWIPAEYYRAVMLPMPETFDIGWPNRYLLLADFTASDRMRLLVMTSLTMLTLAGLFIFLKRKKALSVETKAWGITALFALLMFLPLTEPLRNMSDTLKSIWFPWRMQLLFVPALAVFGAVALQHMRVRKTRMMDGLVLAILLIGTNLFVVVERKEMGNVLFERGLAARVLYLNEHHTVWTYLEQRDAAYTFARYDAGGKPLTEVIAGEAMVAVEHFGWNGIRLRIDAQSPSTIRIYHRYFPAWQTAGEGVILLPEEDSGLMRLQIPAGVQTISITRHIYANGSWLLASTPYISGASGVFLAMWLVLTRKRRKTAASVLR